MPLKHLFSSAARLENSCPPDVVGHSITNGGALPPFINGNPNPKQPNGLRYPNGFKNGSLPTTNGKSTAGTSTTNNSLSTLSRQSNCQAPVNGFSRNLVTSSLSQYRPDLTGDKFSNKHIVISVISAMAAVGIVSAQDWLSFLVVFAQLLAIALIILAVINYRAFYIVYKTIGRDLKGGYRYAKILVSVGMAQRSNSTVGKIFSRNVKKHPNKICFYFEDQKWTFKEVDEMSNRIGNIFEKQGLKKGDTVTLFMENRPEYVCIWLGLSKIGVVPALINFNLRLQPLKHCIEVAQAKALIYGHELSDAMQEVVDIGGLDHLPFYCSGHGDKPMLTGSIDLDVSIKGAPHSTPTPSEPINFNDKLLYIYTSGTTGMPKAAVIKHSRCIMAVTGSRVMTGLHDSDVFYSPLPLYHTVGGVLGVGQALIYGSEVALRVRFSATNFWTDCIRYNVTAAQYIGEICRYLLMQPPSPSDKKHKVKLMFGNGLRPQIWEEFAKRFNIKSISEFYGATEGNCNIININNHVGAVGFISRILPFIYPVTLIKVDEVTGEPIRDHRTGLVVRCRPNEEGELVGRIVENHPVREFQGYADSTSTNKKIVRDVFSKGDAAFRTGDVLMMDDFGYFFFKDRTGDTYRWKGENVSTSEVEAVVSQSCGQKDAVVYGVEIPGTEGRAGMAAILDPDETLDFDDFTARISKALPAYARPILIRIVKQIDMTGTYKMKKVDLQKEGFDVAVVGDKIYLFLSGKYVVLDNELHTKLTSGQLRL